MSPAPFDILQAHRWFAVELNNAAWDLVEAAQRSPDEQERMIHAAHAACYHWLQVGTPLHHLRAQVLLATAYAAAGQVDAALRHARRCLELTEAVGDQQSAFDRATVYGCAARAFRLDGQDHRADELVTRAHRAVAEFADAEDQAVYQRLYGGD